MLQLFFLGKPTGLVIVRVSPPQRSLSNYVAACTMRDSMPDLIRRSQCLLCLVLLSCSSVAPLAGQTTRLLVQDLTEPGSKTSNSSDVSLSRISHSGSYQHLGVQVSPGSLLVPQFLISSFQELLLMSYKFSQNPVMAPDHLECIRKP